MTDRSQASWQAAPPTLPPLTGMVHVWGARLDISEQQLAGLERLLSGEERARADRFYRAGDRRRFVAAHGILRSLLGRYLRLDPGAVPLVVGAHGKPRLDPTCGSDLRFNLSHATEVAMFAVADAREVGIDVESPDRSSRNDAIADRYFPHAEAAKLRDLVEEERTALFLRSWVCKEAFAKAVGSGLAGLDVRTIALVAAAGQPPRLEGTTPAARQLLAGWTLVELPPLHGCPGALVAEGVGWEPKLCLWPPV